MDFESVMPDSIRYQNDEMAGFEVFTSPPSITNRAFATELYIKTISAADGKDLRGHDLKNLFDALGHIHV